MGIRLHEVSRDKFELDGDAMGFSFPCCCCIYRHGTDREEPCRTCDHNASAEQDLEPHQRTGYAEIMYEQADIKRKEAKENGL